MSRPLVAACGIGREGQPLVSIDDFSPDPEVLRKAASRAAFGPAGHHYPGIRAALPEEYLRDQLPIVTRAVRDVFGRYGELTVIDASFSIVTTPPGALSMQQRLPHCDAFTPDRIALVHYLSPDGGGTAFFRHRSTGFETVNEGRRAVSCRELDTETRDGCVPPTGYIAGDTPLFERIALVEARFNRAVLYPSFLLHSGEILPEAALSPEPSTGRLTITAFFSVG